MYWRICVPYTKKIHLYYICIIILIRKLYESFSENGKSLKKTHTKKKNHFFTENCSTRTSPNGQNHTIHWQKKVSLNCVNEHRAGLVFVCARSFGHDDCHIPRLLVFLDRARSWLVVAAALRVLLGPETETV